MWALVALLAAGAFAELIDGALGMGFGVTSSSFLLTLGMAPAAASASVHAAEMATTLASGTAHLRYGNVNRKILPWLILPGCVGGVLGAVLLAGLDPSGSRPVVAAFLLAMGALIIVRSRAATTTAVRPGGRTRTAVIGFSAGTLDAFGGGGWGPIATPSLILSENYEPRKAVGTVNLAEFFVTCTIAATFIALLGAQALRWDFVAAVAAGGVIAAPLGARLAARVPPRMLGEVVGSLLVALNARAIAVEVFRVDARLAAFAVLAFLSAVAALMFYRAFGKSPWPAPKPLATAVGREH